MQKLTSCTALQPRNSRTPLPQATLSAHVLLTKLIHNC